MVFERNLIIQAKQHVALLVYNILFAQAYRLAFKIHS
jgi:hypothetical protein